MFNILAQLEAVTDDVAGREGRELQSLLLNDPQVKSTYNFIMGNEKLRLAFRMSRKYNMGEIRSMGTRTEPYIYHILETVDLMRQLNLDESQMIAAMLCNVVENQKMTLDEVRKYFDSGVVQILGKCDLNNNPDEFFRDEITLKDHEIIRNIKLADRIVKLNFLRNTKSYGDRKKSVELVNEYGNFKLKTAENFDKWYSEGTDKKLQTAYENIMDEGHTEAIF